jgi:hypothetical protein
MASERRYKVLDVSPDPPEQTWSAQIEETINRQALGGWELVTAFQREHEALQAGSTVTHLPGLVSTVLIFKQTG